MGFLKKVQMVVSKLLRFAFNCLLPMVFTYQALNDDDDGEISKKTLQWTTLSILMFVESVIYPLLECIPGGSGIMTLLYFWIFAPYFSLADILYNKVLSKVIDTQKIKGFVETLKNSAENNYDTILDDLKQIKKE